MGSSVGENVATGTIDNTLSNLVSGSCGYSDSGYEISYSWTAPASGCYQFSTINVGGLYSDQLDTRLYILDGACEGTELACDDDFLEIVTRSVFEFDVTSGTEYYVVVDGYSSFSTGDFGLSITSCPVAVPEDCSSGLDDDGDGAIDCADSLIVHKMRLVQVQPILEEVFVQEASMKMVIHFTDCEDPDCDDLDVLMMLLAMFLTQKTVPMEQIMMETGLTDCDDSECSTDP